MTTEGLCATTAQWDVVTVEGDETVGQAARRMGEAGIGCLPVIGPDRLLEGVLSERDIIRRVLAAGRDPAATRVRDVMTRPAMFCGPQTPLSDAQEMMARHSIRHVPIVEDGRVRGMISAREALSAQADRARAARELTIFAVAKLAESRDTETGQHLERVRDYVGALARWMRNRPEHGGQIGDEFVLLLEATSSLHDIGKVSVPDFVLLKPGRLTDDEYDIMKTHTTKGAETLDLALRKFPNTRFLRMAREVAAWHHERVDGTGYPDGLRGEEIPLAARIFALADVYDALISRRVYKDAFTHEVARNIILEGEGTQFDPAVVEAFRHCEERFLEIRRRYTDERLAA